jgi:hypothetical protein
MGSNKTLGFRNACSWLIFCSAFIFCCGYPAGNKKVAVILHGESFRAHSHQGSREIGEHGYAPQKFAVRSHITNIFLPLVMDLNYSAVDVFLETYVTPWLEDLKRWYGPFDVVDRELFDANVGRLDNGHFREIMNKSNEYDGILILRPDMIMKDLFPCALASANRSKILFSFRCWTGGDTLTSGRHRIADMITWIPAWAFTGVDCSNCLWLNHDVMDYVVPKFGQQNVGYLLPAEQHDSDPEKDKNPLYSLADRPEGPEVNSVLSDFSCASDATLARAMQRSR